MNQFIASIFAAAVSFSAFSAISATLTEHVDDVSSIGTFETPQVVEQNEREDQSLIQKARAQNVTQGEFTKKDRLLKAKEKNAGENGGDQMQRIQAKDLMPSIK